MKSLPGIISFVKAVEVGSFTKAAQALDISPAAVSKNVQRLEDQLATRLFQRSTRKLSLTEEGELFYERCAQAVRDLDSANQAIAEYQGTPTGHLRISCGTSFARLIVLPLLPGFLAKYPQVSVDMVLDDHIADLIADRFDIAIRGSRLPDSGMVARRLFVLKLGLFASQSYLKRYGTPATVEELRGHNCLRFRFVSTGRLLDWQLEGSGETVTPTVTGNLILSDPEALTQACADGLGIALLAHYVVDHHPQRHTIERVLPRWAPSDRDIYVCYPARKYAPLKTRVFVDYISEQLKTRAEKSPPAP
jgi:LysR family transcriptional regulator, regulator for bpeEF and oprC